jgi:CDP-diacylglycerol--serine O-phosphatidyltransferase
MKQHLPNLLTLANLVCGCCAVVLYLRCDYTTGFYFTVASFLFDYADGLAARALHVSSPLGKELDSIADTVSFAVAPGVILFTLLEKYYQGTNNLMLFSAISVKALPAFLLSAAGGLRLAKFNLDTRQTNGFLGLTTPACTVFVTGLMLTIHNNTFSLATTLLKPLLIYPLIVILSVLMLSELPLFGMKIKPGGMKNNKITFTFFLLSLLLLLFFKELGLSLIIIAYICTTFFTNKTDK